jgi:hypothetical protein
MQAAIDLDTLDGYRLFLKAKAIPGVRFEGRTAIIPDAYAHLLGGVAEDDEDVPYVPSPFLFDYQAAISALAIRRRKFAVFARPGLGKTLILLECLRHALAALPEGKRCLVVSPLMVMRQTIEECQRFYGDTLALEHVTAKNLPAWLAGEGGRAAICSWESIRDGLDFSRVGAMLGDETGYLKSHYGKWGTRLIRYCAGIPYKWCFTGTPAPNDRIEFANHAVLLGRFPTVNSFLARYFINRGETSNRWELKGHALKPFYRELSDWCIFLDNPGTYGWKDNSAGFPPINVHTHDIALTEAQQALVSQAGGDMYGTPGGIGSRAKVAQLAKGWWKGSAVESNKGRFIRDIVASWSGSEQTIVWAKYNQEQERLASLMPGAESITGTTPEWKRVEVIKDFQAGRVRTVISKEAILGLGLNLQCATRQVFSTAQDSAEDYLQAIMRSNRVGSTRPLNVHIPLTPLELPMYQTIVRKLKRIEEDAREQESLFREVSLTQIGGKQ